MPPEATIQKQIQLALSEAGCLIWRNETGNFWAGKQLHRAGEQVTLSNARMVPCGLCKGSSDLIGVTPQGLFLAVEVKTATGKASKEQLNFIDRVNQSGGIAGICRSVDDALELIRGEQ